MSKYWKYRQSCCRQISIRKRVSLIIFRHTLTAQQQLISSYSVSDSQRTYLAFPHVSAYFSNIKSLQSFVPSILYTHFLSKPLLMYSQQIRETMKTQTHSGGHSLERAVCLHASVAVDFSLVKKQDWGMNVECCVDSYTVVFVRHLSFIYTRDQDEVSACGRNFCTKHTGLGIGYFSSKFLIWNVL